MLELGRNDLTGPIPPELGHLGSLRELYLRDNDLTGPIPSQLGGLAYLQELLLHGNDLTGPIPPSLGRLDSLAVMDLANNHLAGPVPRELGRLSSLRELAVTNNVAMAGPLPVDLAGLSRLDALLTGGTGLCAPADPGFQAWLDGVYQQRVVNCSRRAGAVAYLTQAVQSRDFPVPLVAGENALLRVFLTASRANSAGIPAARARFFANAREIHVEDIPGKSGPIPTEVDEGNLSTASHAEIPAEVIQPGLEMVIEADPDGALDPALAVAKRIPETGRLPVNVRHMPLLDLTVVPFLWISEPDSAVLELAAGMAADPGGHELLEATRTLLPVGDLMVTAHEPVLTNNSSIFQLINEVVAIRAMEGGANHYLGMMTPSPNGAAGIARLRGRSSFAAPGTHTIAHELGHNFGLEHAPCGRPGSVDPSFPHSDGSTGSWGFDSRNVRLIHPSTPDLMSYCHPQWIGDYSFANALRFRLSEADSVGLPQPPPAAVNGLLLWGGLTSDSEPFLEPAFVVSAPPRLPQRSGDYRITGRTHHGTELFRFAFAMPKIVDGDGSSGFAFVLPLRPGWEDSLASITLTGPDGSATLDEDSDVPMAILRNPRTGQVRGLLRDLPRATQVASDGAVGVGAQGLDVLFSRGLPNFEARKR